MSDPAQIDRLLNELRRDGEPPSGEHVSDDQALMYSTEVLSTDEQAAIDAHLAGCRDCAARMEHLLAGVERWRGDDGRARLIRVSERLHRAVNAFALFQRFVESVAAPAALPAAAASAVNVSSSDGLDHVVLEDTAEGDLLVRISSRRSELAGTEWSIEPFARVVRLAWVSPTEVGVETLVPRGDRGACAPHAALRIVPAPREE